MVSLLPLLNFNQCAAGVMEILFLFRKLVLTQSDIQKIVSVSLDISRLILQLIVVKYSFFFQSVRLRYT